MDQCILCDREGGWRQSVDGRCTGIVLFHFDNVIPVVVERGGCKGVDVDLNELPLPLPPPSYSPAFNQSRIQSSFFSSPLPPPLLFATVIITYPNLSIETKPSASRQSTSLETSAPYPILGEVGIANPPLEPYPHGWTSILAPPVVERYYPPSLSFVAFFVPSPPVSSLARTARTEPMTRSGARIRWDTERPAVCGLGEGSKDIPGRRKVDLLIFVGGVCGVVHCCGRGGRGGWCLLLLSW